MGKRVDGVACGACVGWGRVGAARRVESKCSCYDAGSRLGRAGGSVKRSLPLSSRSTRCATLPPALLNLHPH